MPVSDGFVDFVLEQLGPLGTITTKPMFGGVGLYAGELFFAVIMGDVLYMKTDDAGRGALIEAGARPFEPFRKPVRGKQRYYSVPAVILEDGDAVLAWAKQSVQITRAHTQG